VLGVGLVLAVAVAVFARWGPDWPAQEFRAWSAVHAGLTGWTNQWYSGVALPGYSVIYPAVSSVLGAAPTGVLAVAAAGAGAWSMAPPHQRGLQIGFHASVAFVLVADLLIGQVPYLLGVAFGIWAVRAVRAQHLAAAGTLALLSSLSSPLAGLFLLISAPALARAHRTRDVLPLVAAGGGLLMSVIYGGASGPFPFLGRILGYVLGFAVLAIVLPGPENRAVRLLGTTYGIVALALFLIPNPVGGNVARLGQLVALPLVWHLLPRLPRRAVALLLVAAAMLWSGWPSITSAARGATDPSRLPPYYAGLLSFLRTRNPIDGRLEVVFTREHWESYYVGRAFPLARGWERQTDLGVNHVLYGPTSAAAYRQWLVDNGVAIVALPNAPIDFGGRGEANLLRHVPKYLVPVWHDRHWRVWRVVSPAGLVAGPATMDALGSASFGLNFARRGTAVVRIRADSMWSVTKGEACVTSTPDGWLSVSAPAAGTVTLQAQPGLGPLAARTRCS
jgi:hypothetical protein